MKKLLFLLFLPIFSFAQLPTGCELTVLADNLNAPWEIEMGPDGRIWFTEKYGTIKVLNTFTKAIKELTIIPNIVTTGEGGLLGMAFDPDFKNNKFLYCIYNFTPSQSLQRMRVIRFTHDEILDTLKDLKVILDGIKSNNIHNGSRITFGADGKMYVSTGNAEGNGTIPPDPNSQNNLSLNGKVLRLNKDGSIPNDNPVQGSYIYSKGHRNIQGLAYGNNKLYASEHGFNEDEINIIQTNRNYGWPGVEAWADNASEVKFKKDSNCVDPIFVFNNASTNGDKAPSGMIYYNHSLIPSLQNSLLVGTLNANGRDISQFKLNTNGDSIIGTNTFFRNEFGRMRDLAQSIDGRIFFCTSNKDQYGAGVLKPGDDKIYEIKPIGYTPIKQINNETLSIFPNPANRNIYIKNSILVGNSSFTIYNVDGKIMDQKNEIELIDDYLTVDISNLQNGIYILQLHNNGKLFIGKVLILK